MEIISPPVDPLVLPEAPTRRRFLIHPFTDFWLLGGASILIFLALLIGTQFRESSATVQSRFYQLAMTFAMLSLFCNHPHFIISYKFGYGRGWKFVFQNWFSLIVVPVGLIAMFGVAYFYFDTGIPDSAVITSFNSLIEQAGLRFQIGIGNSLGWEILALSVWLMYFTVGWHYSKQVYGCMMVYAHFDRYPLSEFEKRILRINLYSIALYQFTYLSKLLDQGAMGAGYSSDMRFPGVKMTLIGLPEMAATLGGILVAVMTCFTGFLFLRKFLKSGALPSANFMIPWVAFIFWWVFSAAVPEFLFIVPFFHSLQYLPFAYTFEASAIKRNRWLYTNVSVRVILLLIVGFMAFEFVPDKIDRWLDTEVYKAPFFFVTAFLVFINIHHFFIDSVAWRFSDKKVREAFTHEIV